MKLSAVVAQRSRDRRREDRRQGRADGLQRGGAERADRRASRRPRRRCRTSPTARRSRRRRSTRERDLEPQRHRGNVPGDCDTPRNRAPRTKYARRMTSDLDLRGVWVPLITPFDATGRGRRRRRSSACAASTRRRCQRHRRARHDRRGERARAPTRSTTVIDAVVARVQRGRHARDRRHRIEQHRRDDRARRQALAGTPGVVGALVVVPYYVRPSVEGIVAHFQAVAAASPVPVIAYNIPYAHRPRSRRGRSARARGDAEHRRREAGRRHARRRHARGARRRAATASRVLGGEDTLLFPLMCMGAVGTISAAAHLCTERFVAMIECGLAGKIEDGRGPRRGAAARDPGRLRRPESRGVQGCAARAGPDRRRPTCGFR